MLKRLVFVAALGVLPALAMAQQKAGQWDLGLNGAGTSDKDIRNSAFSVNGELGYFFAKELELSFRQSIAYSTVNDDSNTLAISGVGGDYFFDMDRFQPFIGAVVSYNYGDSGNDSFSGGPEVGLRYYVLTSTYVQGRVNYQFSFDNWDNALWVYTLGIGFNF